MGNIETLLAQINNDEKTVLNAISYYERSLKVFNIDEYPKYYKSSFSLWKN